MFSGIDRVLKRKRSLSAEIVLLTLIMIVGSGRLAILYAGTPHGVYGSIKYPDGTWPANLYFRAHITTRVNDSLTESTVGSAYYPSTGQWLIQCASFENNWSAEDVLHIEFTDSSGATGICEVTLTSNPYDDAGTCILNKVILKVKVLLQGSYSGSGMMSTILRTGNYIPSISPYADNRSVTSIPLTISDWVSVELRDTPTGQPVTQKSFFLKNDGDIVDEDGTTTDCVLSGVPEGSYYIVVEHYNHLKIMTASPWPLNRTNAVLYDFTAGTNQYYGQDAAALGSGYYGMYAGDTNGTGIITNADKIDIATDLNQSGYYNADANGSGIVTHSDKDVILQNLNKSSMVQ